MIAIFSEGRQLATGIQSKVAFKIVDQSGKGMKVKDFVVNKNNELRSNLPAFKFGIGKFHFTPKAGSDYRAIIKLPDTTFTRQLPTST